MKFRRQHALGPYIADFYVAAHKLVIEVDGPAHLMPESQAYDAFRDHWMRARGYAVLRFAAQLVLDDPSYVVGKILQWLASRSHEDR